MSDNTFPELIKNNVNLEDTLDVSYITISSVQQGRKHITYIRNLPFTKYEIAKHFKHLRNTLACGGTIKLINTIDSEGWQTSKRNTILLMGNHIHKCKTYFESIGQTVKILI